MDKHVSDIRLRSTETQSAFTQWTNRHLQNGKIWQERTTEFRWGRHTLTGETFKIHVFPQTDILKYVLGLETLPLISQFGGTDLSKKQVVYMDLSYVSPSELLMSLNRRMSDCDKLIDSFCGNTSVLITGNAVLLAHIRSLTCSHNNKLTQSWPVFPFSDFSESTPFNVV